MIGDTNCTSDGTSCTKSTSAKSNNNNVTPLQPNSNRGFVTQQQKQKQEPQSTSQATATSSSHATTATTTSPYISSCLPCIQLLQDALLRSDSRPMQLLQRMMLEQKQNEQLQQPRKNIRSTKVENLQNDTNAATAAVRWKKSLNGVIVEIPSSSSAATSSNNIRNNHDSNGDDPLQIRTNQQQLQLATSVKTKKNMSDETKTNKLTEWISLSCKICASTGPEANARAFVMGPTPLSIVVCQNRLVQTKPITISSASPQYYYATSSSHPKPPEQVLQQQQHQQPRYQDRESGISIDTTTKNSFDGNINSSNRATPASSMIHFTDKQRNEMDEILTHELIHVYDIRQLQLDLRDCQNLAYSEVRAAREAECSKYYRNYNQLSSLTSHPTETMNQQSNTTSQTAKGSPEALTATSWSSMFFPSSSDSTAAMANRCVRKKALLATNNLFPVTGKSCIESVFERAYNDHRPFNALAETNIKPIASTSTRSVATMNNTSNATSTETNVTTSAATTRTESTTSSTRTTVGNASDTTATNDSLNLNRTLNRYFSIPLTSHTTTPTASSR